MPHADRGVKELQRRSICVARCLILELPSRVVRSGAVGLVNKQPAVEQRSKDVPELYMRRLWPTNPPFRLGLPRLHGPIRVKRSGSTKGVLDGQDRQALLA
jgi:hypothetical protein